MAGRVEAPYGPWSELFSGTWAGYEMRVYENPDKLVLTLIYDGPADAAKGVVTILNRFYTSEAEVSRLAAALGGHSFVLEKNYPAGRARFFSLSSGPRYVAPAELASAVESAHASLEERSEQMAQLARGFGLALTELKHAPADLSSKLFSEPVLAAGLVSAADQSSKQVAGTRVVLGKKSTGEAADEIIQSFANTVVVGPSEGRRQAVKIMLENCVLAGLTAFVFDEDGSFSGMGGPNNSFDYKTYPDLQPIGMPVKNVPLSAVAADLNLLTTRMLREIMGVPGREGEYAGRTALEMIDGALEENRRKLTSVDDLEAKLLNVKDESKKFHMYRAVRIVRVLKRALPRLLGGPTELSVLVPAYARSTGTINRLDVSGLPANIKKTLAFSLLRSLYEKYREERSPQLRVMLFFANGAIVAPQKLGGDLDAGLLEMLGVLNACGVGFCLGAEHAIDLNQEVAGLGTMRVDFVSSEEIAVRGADTRPYRAKLRPPLSA